MLVDNAYHLLADLSFVAVKKIWRLFYSVGYPFNYVLFRLIRIIRTRRLKLEYNRSFVYTDKHHVELSIIC